MTRETNEILQRTVRELQAAVDRLEDRVRVLEGRDGPVEADLAAGAGISAASVSDSPPSARDLTMGKLWYLAGRSVLLMAGAFLLRFMTDAGTLPPLPGVLAGVLYGLVLAGMVEISGRRGERAGAVAYGLVLAAVAYPLVLETTASRAILTAPQAAGCLAVTTAAGLAVAWRRGLRLLAWVITLAATLVSVVLIRATGADLVFAWLLLGLGASTCLLAYTRHWHLKRWVVAAILNLVVLRQVLTAGGNPTADLPGPPPGSVLGLALALLVVYLGIFTWRALVQGRGVKVFDVVQSALVLAVGFGGAVRVSRLDGSGGTVLGWVALAASLAYYAVAFTAVRTRHGRGRGFFYFASLALVFLFLGSLVVARGPWLIWCWTALGLAAAALGARFDRVTLRYHAAAYLILAALQSSLLKASLSSFLSPADGAWTRLGAGGMIAMAGALGGYLILVLARSSRPSTAWRRVPRMVLAALFLCGLGHFAVLLLVQAGTQPPPAADAALTALVRTLVVALTAVALAIVASRWGLRELGWLVYPVLLFGCAKVLLEDLQTGKALTLTLAFAALGAALILGPRLLRGTRRTTG